MTAWYAAWGMTLLDALQAIYETYGYYGENTLNLVMPGLEGMGKMQAIMAALRQDTPTRSRAPRSASSGTTRPAPNGTLPQGDYRHGAGRVQRAGIPAWPTAPPWWSGPSGTEPKIKVYVLASGTDSADCQRKVEQYTAWAETLRHLAD